MSNKKPVKKLQLSKDTIRDLRAEEAAAARGGQPNNNGTLRCSRVNTCQTYILDCNACA